MVLSLFYRRFVFGVWSLACWVWGLGLWVKDSDSRSLPVSDAVRVVYHFKSAKGCSSGSLFKGSF